MYRPAWMIEKISSRKTGAMIENSSALVPRWSRRRLLDLRDVVGDDVADDVSDEEREDDDDG